MTIGLVPANARFKRIDPVDESGSEVAQDSDLWDKIRVNADLTEVLASAYNNAVIGTHFSSNVEPWFLRTTLGTGASVTYGYNNKHQVKLTGGTTNGHCAVIDQRNDANNSAADAEAFFYDPAWADFLLEFRFSLNINFTDHEIWMGISDSNSATVDPTNYIALRKGASGNLKFQKAGIGSLSGSSAEFAAGNNDNGTTYKSVRMAFLNSSNVLKCYYDKDGAGDWIERWSTTLGTSLISVIRCRPVFRSQRVATSAGDILLDAYVWRPISVLEL